MYDGPRQTRALLPHATLTLTLTRTGEDNPPQAGAVFASTSHDDGVRWSAAAPLGSPALPNPNAKADLLALQPAGALALVFNDHGRPPITSMPTVRSRARDLCLNDENTGLVPNPSVHSRTASESESRDV
jgi:hypothetical protein